MDDRIKRIEESLEANKVTLAIWQKNDMTRIYVNSPELWGGKVYIAKDTNNTLVDWRIVADLELGNATGRKIAEMVEDYFGSQDMQFDSIVEWVRG